MWSVIKGQSRASGESTGLCREDFHASMQWLMDCYECHYHENVDIMVCSVMDKDSSTKCMLRIKKEERDPM